MAYRPSPSAADASLLPLSRPQLAEARRVRAVELFEEGGSNAEIARAVGVCVESVRPWRGAWEEGGASALRRRAATGRPPKLDDAQVETVRAAPERGAQAHGFEADLWTLERVGAVVERVTGVVLSRASVWRLLTGRLQPIPATSPVAGSTTKSDPVETELHTAVCDGKVTLAAASRPSPATGPPPWPNWACTE
jgi:transposase